MVIASTAQSQLLFEGYSKVYLGSKHVGYVIQRFEFDQKKKEFLATNFLKTDLAGNNVTESTQSRASATLKPLSYKYTSAAGDKVKIIDATFKGDTMNATVIEGGKRKALPPQKLPTGAFLGNYLPYVMLQGKEGIKVGANYGYQAVAEEFAAVYTGQAFVKGEETFNGVPVFRVLSSFMIGTPMKSEYIFFVTAKGEIIGSKSPAQDISTEVVASLQEASAGLSVNNNHLKQLFGGIPAGLENAIARKSGGSPLAAPPTKQQTLQGGATPSTESPKTEGVPGGQGLTIKGTVEAKDDPTPTPTAPPAATPKAK
jgi:hypothetical protein